MSVVDRTISGRRVRWDDQRAADAYARGLWVHETLADSLKREAAEAPDCVLIADGKHRLDCRTLHDSATLAGMVANPILPSLRDRELSFILKDADAKLIFAPSSFRQNDYAAMLNRVTAQLESPPLVIILRGDAGPHTQYASFLEDRDSRRELPALDPDAARMVMFTSGTTGSPKAVMHTHNSIHALICQLREHWPGTSFSCLRRSAISAAPSMRSNVRCC